LGFVPGVLQGPGFREEGRGKREEGRGRREEGGYCGGELKGLKCEMAVVDGKVVFSR
jgi:hypothetical protein